MKLIKSLFILTLIGLIVIVGLNQGLSYFFRGQINAKIKANDAWADSKNNDFQKVALKYSQNHVYEIQAEKSRPFTVANAVKQLKITQVEGSIAPAECDAKQLSLISSLSVSSLSGGLLTGSEAAATDSSAAPQSTLSAEAFDTLLNETTEKLKATVPNWLEIQKNLDLISVDPASAWIKDLTMSSALTVDASSYQDFLVPCGRAYQISADRLALEAFARFAFLMTRQKEVDAFSEITSAVRLFFGSHYDPFFQNGLQMMKYVTQFLKDRAFTNDIFTSEQMNELFAFQNLSIHFSKWVSHSDAFRMKVFSSVTPVSLPLCHFVSATLQRDDSIVQLAILDQEKFRALADQYRNLLNRCNDDRTLASIEARVAAQKKTTASPKDLLKKKLFGTATILQFQLNELELDKELHLEI